MGTLITSATGRYYTSCKLCQRRIAETGPLDVPLIGDPGRKVEKLVTVLLKHLTRDHAPEFERGVLIAKELPPFLILSAYEFEEPTITPRLENIRAAIFQLVRKNTMPDDALRTVIARLGFSGDDAARIFEAMAAIRDSCCEIGNWRSGSGSI